MFSELLREITDLTPWKESIDAYISNLSINSVIVTVMMIFMLLGAIDKARGNKRGYGAAFDEGFQAMGPLAIAMVGVIAAAPVLSMLPVILVAVVLAAGLWFKPIALMNVAFASCAAFMFGDHLGFVAGVSADMIVPMIFAKLACGLSALALANLLAPQLLSKAQKAAEND